jgi:hypothetical protein
MRRSLAVPPDRVTIIAERPAAFDAFGDRGSRPRPQFRQVTDLIAGRASTTALLTADQAAAKPSSLPAPVTAATGPMTVKAAEPSANAPVSEAIGYYPAAEHKDHLRHDPRGEHVTEIGCRAAVAQHRECERDCRHRRAEQ